jgi:hypothetical protein
MNTVISFLVLDDLTGNHRHRTVYKGRDHIHVQRHNMDIVSLYMMNGNDNQENDYHILSMNNNNISRRNSSNVHNSNVRCKAMNDHDHMDNMCDVSVRN